MIHSFDTELAAKYGVNCAILLNNLWFWVEKNRANEINFHDGKYWTYNSQKAMSELFPYFTAKQIRTTIDKLVSEGLVEKGNYNESQMDRTLWYTITEKGLAELTFKSHAFAQMGKYNSIYSTIDTNITDNKHTYTLGDSVESAEIESPSEHPSDVDEFFNSVWQLYPRKLGKSAVKKTQRKKLQKVGYDTLKRCIDNFKDYIATHGIQEQYVMYGSTFFNGRYVDWMDDSEIPQAAQQIKDGDWE